MRQRSWVDGPHPEADHCWGVIMAGGQGKRLRQYILSRFGEDRPKQYCALTGRRSMFRHTIDRVAPLFAPDHLLTSVNAAHLRFAMDELHDRPPQTVIIQPVNRETAPGILQSLLYIHAQDPRAIVAFFPADHFILQEEQFRYFVHHAFRTVAAVPERMVLLGIAPTSNQPGYGWIETESPSVPGGIHAVRRFWEKPIPAVMHYLEGKGCLWNTMTVLGTAELLLRLIERHLPELFEHAGRIARSLGTDAEHHVTETVFASIPEVNFSRALLQKVPHHLSVLRMHGVYWNDWGDEQRVRADLEMLEHPSDLLPDDRGVITAE